MSKKVIPEFKKDLESMDKFLLYGAGYVADVVFCFLNQENLSDRLHAILVEDCSVNPSVFHGKKVEKYTEYLFHKKKL